MCDLSAFKHMLELTSLYAGADWTEQKQIPPNFSNLAFLDCFKNVRNLIQMALKWLFFPKKNCQNRRASSSPHTCQK